MRRTRSHCAIQGLAMGYLCLLMTAALSAQEFRVSTRTYDLSQVRDDGKPPVISRSLTLFHAGKIYDYLDSVGEVIILEPAHNRVTVLNTRRQLTTTVHFDEIKQLLKVRETETEKYVHELLSQNSPDADADASKLRFQLDPQFTKRFDKSENQMSCSSSIIEYSVQCAIPPSTDLISSYLNYADWVARLNSILHSQALFPEARIQLNSYLREQKRIPVEVTLSAELESQLQLQSQHDFVWALDNVDRRLIHHWELVLREGDLEKTSLVEYQRKMLLSVIGRK